VKKRAVTVVDGALEMAGRGPETRFLPTKWEVVSGAREHLSEPGSWTWKRLETRAARVWKAVEWQTEREREAVRMSST
jgi:hypothetical protein